MKLPTETQKEAITRIQMYDGDARKLASLIEIAVSSVYAIRNNYMIPSEKISKRIIEAI